jgi:hypothetical protein
MAGAGDTGAVSAFVTCAGAGEDTVAGIGDGEAAWAFGVAGGAEAAFGSD